MLSYCLKCKNLLTVLVDHLLNINKKFKSLKKLEIQTIYTKMN